jgi:diaminobutyrate-2-oxoglutarate transaminase
MSRIVTPIFKQLESSVQSYARHFPAVFARAKGAEVWDQTGRRYLDFLGGAGALNYGHNNPVLKLALQRYLQHDGIGMSLDLHTEAKADFLEALLHLILGPRGLDHVVQFTGPTGTNAVEAALKIARKATGRTNVISFTNGYHGMSLGALSATGSSYHRRGAGVPLWGTSVMPYDGYLGRRVDTTDYLERVLDDPSSGVDQPAAVIVECVQGEGGLQVASAAWLRKLAAICRARGIVLIVYDIQAGCGRTGPFFSFERAGITPDIVTLSKSLSGSGMPMSIVLIRRDLDCWQPGEHNGTFRGNNLAFVTAAAMLRCYWATADFERATIEKAAFVDRRLQAIRACFPEHVATVRGAGMMQGLVCRDPLLAAAAGHEAFERGLIIERAGPHDEVLKCFAPLVTPLDQLAEGLDILEAALAAVVPAAAAIDPAPPVTSDRDRFRQELGSMR